MAKATFAGGDSTATTGQNGTDGVSPAKSTFAEEIQNTARDYAPGTYANGLSFMDSLSLELDPLSDSFIPLTSTQSVSVQNGTGIPFIVGIIPPSANITKRLLDRSSSIAALSTLLPDTANASGDGSYVPGGSDGTLAGDEGFWDKFVFMCNRLGVKPEDMAHVLNCESGLRPDKPNPNTGGKEPAKGLNQMLYSTAVGELGKDGKYHSGIGMPLEVWQNFEHLSREEQLPWVEKCMRGGSLTGPSKIRGFDDVGIWASNFGGYPNPDGSRYSTKQHMNEWCKTDPAAKTKFKGDTNACLAAFTNPDHQDLSVQKNPGFSAKGFITKDDQAKVLKGNPLPANLLAAVQAAKARVGNATDNGVVLPDANSANGWQNGGSGQAAGSRENKDAVADRSLDLNNTPIGQAFQTAYLTEANDIQSQIDRMASTPPLKLLVNPNSFKVNSEKIIADGDWGRNGPIVEHWGEQQDKIEGSGKIAGFFAIDKGASGASSTVGSAGNGPGITRIARNFSAGYQNLFSLYLLYRNNGGLWWKDPANPNQRANLALMGSVYVFYDNTLYIGAFDDFTITEAADSPHSLEYNFSFSVRATFLLDSPPPGAYTQRVSQSQQNTNTASEANQGDIENIDLKDQAETQAAQIPAPPLPGTTAASAPTILAPNTSTTRSTRL